MGTENGVTLGASGQWLDRRPHAIPATIAALMLLAALGDWPYGYYQLLRLVVCGVGGYVAWVSYNSNHVRATWLFAAIAVLFNPLIPFHLSRGIWQPVDLACAVLFLTAILILKGGEKCQS